MEKKKDEPKKTKIVLKLEPVNKKKLTIKVIGKTPLISDRFSEKAEDEILKKQTGIARSDKKKVRELQEEIKDAIHVTQDGKIGYPASAFHKGMMNCTSFVGDKFFSKKLVL